LTRSLRAQSLGALEALLAETGAHSLFFNNLYDAVSLVRRPLGSLSQ
jgi:hypothetical protein